MSNNRRLVQLPNETWEALLVEVSHRLAHGNGRPNASAVVRDAVSAYGTGRYDPDPYPLRPGSWRTLHYRIPAGVDWPAPALVRAACVWYLALPMRGRHRDLKLSLQVPPAGRPCSLAKMRAQARAQARDRKGRQFARRGRPHRRSTPSKQVK